MIRRAVLIGLAAALTAAALPARADDYPSRSVVIVCPYPAGGPTDQLARIVADSLPDLAVPAAPPRGDARSRARGRGRAR